MDRLGSYLAETGGDLKSAIALYDWNVLSGYVAARGWPGAWYEQDRLFAGRQNQKAATPSATPVTALPSHRQRTSSRPPTRSGQTGLPICRVNSRASARLMSSGTGCAP